MVRRATQSAPASLPAPAPAVPVVTVRHCRSPGLLKLLPASQTAHPVRVMPGHPLGSWTGNVGSNRTDPQAGRAPAARVAAARSGHSIRNRQEGGGTQSRTCPLNTCFAASRVTARCRRRCPGLRQQELLAWEGRRRTARGRTSCSCSGTTSAGARPTATALKKGPADQLAASIKAQNTPGKQTVPPGGA